MHQIFAPTCSVTFGFLRYCLASIYPEALGHKDAHWLVDPTGRDIPPSSLITVISGMQSLVCIKYPNVKECEGFEYPQ